MIVLGGTGNHDVNILNGSNGDSYFCITSRLLDVDLLSYKVICGPFQPQIHIWHKGTKPGHCALSQEAVAVYSLDSCLTSVKYYVGIFFSRNIFSKGTVKIATQC